MGSGVHIQEESLSCPNWPLCLRQGTPHLELWATTLTHHLLASVVGILTLGTSLYLHFKREIFRRESLRWSWWASVLVILQGLLGALSVKYKFPTLISTAHLIFSAVFLCSLWGTYLSFTERRRREKSDFFSSWPVHWALGMVLVIFFQMTLGGIIRHFGASQACGLGLGHTYFCFEHLANSLNLWSAFPLAQWHLAHRLFALFTLAFILVGTWQIHKSLSPHLDKRFHLRYDLKLLIFFLISQLFIGLWLTARGLAPIPRLLHLLFAMMTLLPCFGLYLKLRIILKESSGRDKADDRQDGHHSPGVLADMLALTKPRLTALVVLTSLIGLILAPNSINFLTGLGAMMAIAVLVAGTAALNCYLEREVDKRMRRTVGRPLPSGRLSPLSALIFSVLLILPALFWLGIYVNLMTAFLGLLAMILYLYAYTPLKKKSIFALFIGAIPGAIPPVLGWTSATGSLDSFPLVLFGIIFTWQIPHFIAISLYRKEDYQNAKLKIIPIEHGDQSAKVQIFIYGLLLVFISFLPFFLQLAGKGYFYCALFLGLLLSLYALRGIVFRGEGFDEKLWARKYFLATLGYLPLLLIALVMFSPPFSTS